MDYFTVVVALLLVLAILDLSIGVSNDAVNFLNSAIGSQVATRRAILMVATAGILLGAMFSSGIMEVARKGVFNPDLFTFADIMVVFLAVMLADVLLLDLFNTFGMPTSTTVSIVFELLGAATAVALLLSLKSPETESYTQYINAGNALIIISGIGLSVVVAFVTGAMVQFISRLLLTFDRARRGGLILLTWSALALTAISYFLLIKGLKDTGLLSQPAMDWLLEQLPLVLCGLFVAWLMVCAILKSLRVEPLALVVLGGTFALAMAFASNDLVNFIGVPLAGLESWQAWQASGLEADELSMEILLQPVASGPVYLLAAGAIMAATLWISEKARTVTGTEVNLARQGEGHERFTPGPLSKGLVYVSIRSFQLTRALVPQRLAVFVALRYQNLTLDTDTGQWPGEPRLLQTRPNSPAFDLVRASVNLTVASILIAMATSLKLPLSTTFVSFMVAMGSSLADRAWGVDSAPQRVAGVLSVLAGWFLTAVAAFTLAGIFAAMLRFGGAVALAILLVVVPVSLMLTSRYHRRQRAS